MLESLNNLETLEGLGSETNQGASGVRDQGLDLGGSGHVQTKHDPSDEQKDASKRHKLVQLPGHSDGGGEQNDSVHICMTISMVMKHTLG